MAKEGGETRTQWKNLNCLDDNTNEIGYGKYSWRSEKTCCQLDFRENHQFLLMRKTHYVYDNNLK